MEERLKKQYGEFCKLHNNNEDEIFDCIQDFISELGRGDLYFIVSKSLD